ncbi:MAG: hypothetical protein M1835_004804 [Candelina submexicana]|nr:MAG: hypothetical protein M1835_004804 [Candelina submexicana]
MAATHLKHSSLFRRHTDYDGQASLESLLLRQNCHIPRSTSPHLQCCCGRQECAFLKHKNTALEGLEKDVQTAAQLGQALLIRHEAYMADAEQERLKMTADIEKLERDKQKLEAENARTIEENRNLLSQLEDLNTTVTESDAHIKSLDATLLSTQKELQRLTALASRTEQLESQLASLEQDQLQLYHTLAETKEDERCAVHRWKRAERTLVELGDQIERIEKESSEERERHVEVVGRMERKRAVEKELERAAGRLKGAAAVTMGRQSNGTNIVSHFVKDILQDNANLQLGIVELREMLMISNDEIQSLREHVLFDPQPLTTDNANGSQTPTLGMELAMDSLKDNSPALHVYHHYHAPHRVVETPAKDKASIHRKKRRTVTTPSKLSPSSAALRTPRTARSRAVNPQCSSTSSAILSQTSVSIPSPTPRSLRRLSTTSRSSIAPSSVPSSPRSIYQMSSIFDRSYSDTPLGSSRPTSPESYGPGSPQMQSHREPKYSPRHFNNSIAVYAKAVTPAPILATLDSTIESADTARTSHPGYDHDHAPTDQATVAKGDESPMPHGNQPVLIADSELGSDDIFASTTNRPSLRRAASHESLLSVSGMDIQTLRHRPSQILSTGKGFSPSTPFSISSPSTALLSSKPVVSATTATARPPPPRRGYDSSSYRTLLTKPMHNPTTQARSSGQKTGSETLGKRMGGWVWGKWGVSPAASTGNLRAKAALTAASDGRPSKVNQGGKARASSAQVAGVTISEVDEDLLKESLGG